MFKNMVVVLLLLMSGQVVVTQDDVPDVSNFDIITRENIEELEFVDTIVSETLETITDVTFNDNDNLLILGDIFSGNNLLEVWNIDTLTQNYILEPVDQRYLAGNVEVSDDYIVVPLENSIQIWDVTSGNELLTISDAPNIVHLFPQSDLLAFTISSRQNGGDAIIFWDIEESIEIARLPHPNISKFTVSSDGLLLASASVDGSVRLWNISEEINDSQYDIIREADSNLISDLSFINDNFLQIGVLLTSDPNLLQIWDYQLNEWLDVDYDTGFRISNDIFATRLEVDTWQLWNIVTRENLAQVPFTNVSSTADPNVFATTGRNPITIFDSVTGDVIREIECELSCFSAFSSDSRYLVIWDFLDSLNSNRVEIWGIPSE